MCARRVYRRARHGCHAPGARVRLPEVPEARQRRPHPRLRLGCTTVDEALRGGILPGGITEIVGESATGKTQFCLQLSLAAQLPPAQGGLGGRASDASAPHRSRVAGAVFVSTEHAFPDQRLQQMLPHFSRRHPAVLDPGSGIIVEHADSVDGLWHVVAQRIPFLLAKTGNVRLIVIDSIAALFRAEPGLPPRATAPHSRRAAEAVARSQRVAAMGQTLKALADAHGLAVVCSNQVSDHIGGGALARPARLVIPALGLAWSNAVNTRLLLQRRAADAAVSRTLDVVLAAHLPNITVHFAIAEAGIVAA